MQISKHDDVSREWATGWLLAVTLLGAVLRLVEMNSSFWADEQWTRMCAQHGLRWTLTMWGVSLNPGYMYMPVLSGAVFGYGEAALRLPGFIAGVLSIPALYGLLRDTCNRRAGLAGAFLLAVNAYHVDYSVEARMYSCVMFGAILIIWSLCRATVDGGVLRWFLFTLAGLWSVPLHLIMAPFLAISAFAAACGRFFGQTGTSLRQRVLAVAPVAVSAAAAMSSTAVFMSLAGFSPTIFISGWHGSEAQQDGIVPNEIDSGAAFRLTPADYAGFLERFAGVEGDVFKWLFLALALAGLWRLWKRNRALFWLTVTPMVLLPTPFFFVTTTHFWLHRHFCFFLPVIVAWVALGLAGLAELLAGVAPAARIPAPFARERLCGLVFAALVLSLAIASVGPLRETYARRPTEDAKGVVEYISDRITSSDTFCYFSPRARFWTDFSLNLAGGRAAQVSSTARSLLADNPAPDNVAKLIAQRPENAFWFIELGKLPEASAHLLTRLGAEVRPFRGAQLCVLGEPTVNMIALGGAEGASEFQHLRAVLASAGEAYSGESCFRLDNSGGRGSVVELGIARSSCKLRNAGFEVWDADLPAGWTVAAAGGVVRAQDAEPGGRVLAIFPASEETVVEQRMTLGLAPGRKVSVSADIKAAQAGDVSLGVSFEAPGACREGQSRPPGTGTWQRVSYEMDVPPEAYPSSFAVRVRVSPGTREPVLVDNVTVDVPALVGELDPARMYTLSLMVKYDRLIGAEPNASIGRMGKISLVWYDPVSQGSRDIRLDHWAGHSEWRRLVFPVKPDVTVPRGASYVKVVAALSPETAPEGVIWLDEVQFEPLPYPTPFVQGERMPHDETLASLRE